jgi:hypothetical protein
VSGLTGSATHRQTQAIKRRHKPKRYSDMLSHVIANSDIRLNFRQKSDPEKSRRHWRIARLSYIRRV